MTLKPNADPFQNRTNADVSSENAPDPRVGATTFANFYTTSEFTPTMTSAKTATTTPGSGDGPARVFGYTINPDLTPLWRGTSSKPLTEPVIPRRAFQHLRTVVSDAELGITPTDAMEEVMTGELNRRNGFTTPRNAADAVRGINAPANSARTTGTVYGTMDQAVSESYLHGGGGAPMTSFGAAPTVNARATTQPPATQMQDHSKSGSAWGQRPESNSETLPAAQRNMVTQPLPGPQVPGFADTLSMMSVDEKKTYGQGLGQARQWTDPTTGEGLNQAQLAQAGREIIARAASERGQMNSTMQKELASILNDPGGSDYELAADAALQVSTLAQHNPALATASFGPRFLRDWGAVAQAVAANGGQVNDQLKEQIYLTQARNLGYEKADLRLAKIRAEGREPSDQDWVDVENDVRSVLIDHYHQYHGTDSGSLDPYEVMYNIASFLPVTGEAISLKEGVESAYDAGVAFYDGRILDGLGYIGLAALGVLGAVPFAGKAFSAAGRVARNADNADNAAGLAHRTAQQHVADLTQGAGYRTDGAATRIAANHQPLADDATRAYFDHMDGNATLPGGLASAPSDPPVRPATESGYTEKTLKTDGNDRPRYDVDGRPIDPNAVIAGVQNSQQSRTEISALELGKVINQLTGRQIKIFNPVGDKAGVLGETRQFDDGSQLVSVARGVIRNKGDKEILAHELGHVLHNLAKDFPAQDHIDDLTNIYSFMHGGRGKKGASAKESGPLILPQHRGYKPEKAVREQVAEAVRLYIENPDYIKDNYPALAAAMRQHLSNKTIHFNSAILPTAAAAAIGAGMMQQQYPQDEDQADELVNY